MTCQACEAIETGINLFNSPEIINTENIVGYVINKEAVSRGHCIFLPKVHYEKMHQIPDNILSEILTTIKQVAKALQLENYNVLQNNGALAFQTLFHAHFHIIPKYNDNDGLRYLRDKDEVRTFDQTGIADKIKYYLSNSDIN